MVTTQDNADGSVMATLTNSAGKVVTVFLDFGNQANVIVQVENTKVTLGHTSGTTTPPAP